MAPEVQKGRPRRRQVAEESKQSKRPARKTTKSAVKAPAPKVHITVPPPKRKNSADAVDESHAERKRVKVVSFTPEPSSSRLSVAPLPTFALQLVDDQLPYTSVLRMLGIVRHAVMMAEAEVHRQMAMGAATPSNVSLEDLLALLMSDGDRKGKGKEKQK